MLNKSERDGKFDQAKGKAKQAAGELLGNEELKEEGRADEAAGAIETAIGNAARRAGDALIEVGKAVKR